MSKNTEAMRNALEALYHTVGDALTAISTLALLAQRECDKGAGAISGRLIVDALYDISYRASDANNFLDAEVEALDIGDASGKLRRVTRGLALTRPAKERS